MKKAIQVQNTWNNNSIMVKVCSCVGPKNFKNKLTRVWLLHRVYFPSSPTFLLMLMSRSVSQMAKKRFPSGLISDGLNTV